MDKFIITDKMMQDAKTYLPIADKQAIAEMIASKCIKDLPTAENNLIGEKFLAMPYLKGEDRRLKDMCLLYTFLTQYLSLEIDLLDEKNYDYYSNDAIYNQIERYKSDFKLKNKAFDLLYDFKELRKMVDVEIENVLRVSNDPLARLMASIQTLTTPENIKIMLEELKKVSEKYSAELKDKKILPNQKKDEEAVENNG